MIVKELKELLVELEDGQEVYFTVVSDFNKKPLIYLIQENRKDIDSLQKTIAKLVGIE